MPQPSGRVVSSRYGQTEAETSPVSTVLRVWQERIFGTAYRQPAAMVLYVNENAVRHGRAVKLVRTLFSGAQFAQEDVFHGGDGDRDYAGVSRGADARSMTSGRFR